MVILEVYLLIGIIFTLVADRYARRYENDSIEGIINRTLSKNPANGALRIFAKIVLYLSLVAVMPFAVVVVAVEMMMGR